MYAAPPSLNLVVLRAKDLMAARRFYEALGIFFEMHKHGSGAEHLASGGGEHGAVFEIYPLRDGQTPTASVRIGFSMDAVDGYMDAVQNVGGKIIEPPHDSEWGRRAVVQDPDGHKVELVTPHGRAG